MRDVAFARLEAAHAQAVQDFVRALSPQSRLERFFAPVVELSPRALERLIGTPGLSLAAWHGGRIVGLAQYALDAGEAEFALVIAEDWRGRGLGEAMLARLLSEARRSGIRAMAGLTLAGNRAMRALARKLGFVLRRDADPDLLRMERELAAT
jgi:GNAT superfamily N-acetyltransferase